MKINEVINLYENGERTISVFDVDDTLFKTTSKIYYRLPNDDKEYALTTSEFAEFRKNPPEGVQYDFRDFRHFDKVYSGVSQGQPIIDNLKILDNAITSGHKIGILTARSNQDAAYLTIKNNVMYLNPKTNELEPLPDSVFKKKYCIAVNDPANRHYFERKVENPTDENVKAYVIKKFFRDLYGFSKVYFYDDDIKNVNAVNNLKDSNVIATKV